MPSFVKPRYRQRRGVPAPIEQPPSEAAGEVFLRHFKGTFNEGEARRAAGLTVGDLAKLRAEDPAFETKYREIDEALTDRIEGFGLSLAANGDGAMVRFLLQCRRREKYGNQAKLDIKVQSAAELKDMPKEELLALRECLIGKSS